MRNNSSRVKKRKKPCDINKNPNNDYKSIPHTLPENVTALVYEGTEKGAGKSTCVSLSNIQGLRIAFPL